jgi:tripartite-type tricarboxylate transporter receptor subunit TctC
VVAPAATPAPVLDQMHAAIVKAMANPKVQESLEAKLMQPVGNTPEQFAAYMRDERERWGPVIRKNNIKLD